jgi:hypothetical protein
MESDAAPQLHPLKNGASKMQRSGPTVISDRYRSMSPPRRGHTASSIGVTGAK